MPMTCADANSADVGTHSAPHDASFPCNSSHPKRLDSDEAAAAAVHHQQTITQKPQNKSPSQPQQQQQPVLSSYDLQGVAELIKAGGARRIVVMAGAGISVSAGIPDFRSPGTGLYSQLQRYNLPWPEAVFDVRYFRHDPKPFCMLAKELWPGYHKHAPTPTHHFLRLLSDKGLLLTVFSQNIDGLEAIAGVPADKVVNAHGSFDGAHCIDCKQACSIYAVQAAVYADEVPTCSSCGGLVKPGITFFGEALPTRFHRRRLGDMQQADLLLVMGTSLLVQPFASMIDQVPASTPRVLINRTRAGERSAHQQQQQQPQKQQQQKQEEEKEGQGEHSAQHQQQQQPCGPSCKFTRRNLHSINKNSISSDSDSDDDDSSCGGVEGGSSVSSGTQSGCVSGASSSSCSSPALTASNSIADIADSCSCFISAEEAEGVIHSPPVAPASGDADNNSSTDLPAAAAAAAADVDDGGNKTGNSSSTTTITTTPTPTASGFNFDSGDSSASSSIKRRDVLHLGDCDSAVMQLAGLLGWQQELERLIAAGDAAFEEAKSAWADDEDEE